MKKVPLWRTHNRRWTCLLCVCLPAAIGCSRLSASRDPGAARTLAEFRGGAVRESDLPRPEVFEAEHALYWAKLARINDVVEKKFLRGAAQKRGMTVDEFLNREVRSKALIPDEDVEKEYLQFMASVKDDPRLKNLSEQEKEKKTLARLGLNPPPGKGFETLVKDKLRENLSKRKERAVGEGLIKGAGLKVYLAEPEPPVYAIPTDGHPSLGPATAPVSIVVFNDFECPYSAKAAPDIKRLAEAFHGKVRVVFYHLPLPGHEYAQKAAEAAECAHAQGKFWEYYDLLVANQEKLGPEDLKQYAARLGLDMTRFNQELQSGTYAARVKKDFDEGVKDKVDGTPAIYINGQSRRGKTLDYFTDIFPYVEEVVRGRKVDDEAIRKASAGILAEVGDIPVTEADLPLGAFYDQEAQLYQTKMEQVKRLLNTKLVGLAAQKQGISADSLYRKEPSAVPTSQEVQAQMEAFRGYVEGNPRLMHLTEPERKKEILTLLKIDPNSPESFDTLVRRKLTEIVRNRKLEQVRPALMARLMQTYDVRIDLQPPTAPVYEIATQGYPSLGPENAPVTIVEFADFQCPYCSQAAPTLNQVLARYPGKVRVVFRNFPLSFHAYAQKAHEAAECANEQGKFWPYHDAIFANQGALGVDDLKKYAVSVGLDAERFNQCIDTGKYAEKVKKDVEEAQKYNVRGTPSFYINGTPQRIQTFEQFAWYITGGKEGSPTPLSRLASAGTCN